VALKSDFCLQVVLTSDINNLGGAGELVNVQQGYMFNYLYPQGLAKRATEDILEYAPLSVGPTSE
jgi:ribosomal protein L9